MRRPVTDLAAVPGVPEAALPPDTLAALPDASPPPPWKLRLDAILWVHPAAAGAEEAVPPAVRGRHLPFTFGGFVRYADTPVGPYHEVFGSPVALVVRGVAMGTVPFMVVDSLASIRGGRENWSLPKTLGTFSWDGDGDVARAEGDSPAGPWSIAARARPRGPAFPFWSPAWNRQAMPGGGVLRVGARSRGRARMAMVTVESDGPSLPSWLVPGEHLGLVLRGARMRFGSPRVLR